MENVVYRSPEKYKIIEIKDLLNDNGIPISSIKLHIYVEWNYRRSKGGSNIVEKRERRDEIIIPIEEFNDKLNDAQTFEIYTDKQYFHEANNLIEKYLNDNIYKNCIFKSFDFEEADNVQRFLRKNNIPCEDVIINYLEDNEEEYLIILNPEYKESAYNLIKNNFNKNGKRNKGNVNSEKYEDDKIRKDPLNNYFSFVLFILGIVIFLYLLKNSIPIIGKLYDIIIDLFRKI